MITIGVIGYGYWGPNIVRNFSAHPEVSVKWVCDINPKTTKTISRTYPTIRVTSSSSDLMHDPQVSAIVIVTPTSTHFSLAREALLSGKHVLVEKPMTATKKESKKLVKIAKEANRILMVDHTFLYTPAICRLKTIIDRKQLGDIFYIDSVRTNLGLIQRDSNVIYDLAAHDFSIIDYLVKTSPTAVSASGFRYKNSPQEAVANITATYPDNLYVHSHVSWLSPVKIRRITFVGTKQMLVYDDMEQSEKIKIYDKSVSVVSDPKAQEQLRIGYRIGSMVAPHVEVAEGLAGMAEAFIKSIQTGKPPISDGSQGQQVVTILEAATRSLSRGGKTIPLIST